MSYLLDTNIVSAILRKNQAVTDKLHELELCDVEVFISCITYYEIKRGLMATNATRQLGDFNRVSDSHFLRSHIFIKRNPVSGRSQYSRFFQKPNLQDLMIFQRLNL